VNEEIDPSEGDEEESAYVLLADLGEGAAIDKGLPKNLGKSRTSRVPLDEYIPPEAQSEGYTTGSDIFGWGQLAIDVIRQNYFALTWEDGQIRFPRNFMFILERCLASDPIERPTAAILAAMTQDVAIQIMGGAESEIDWILGDYKLPEVAQRLSTSLQLSSEWFRSD
jgi:hypothetical protein